MLDPLLRPAISPLFSFEAQLSAKHETNRFHVLRSGDLFWLRLENHPDWLAIYDDAHGQLLAIARSGDEEHLEASLWRALKARSWGRALFLPDTHEKDRFWRVLWREGRAFLQNPESGEAVAFQAQSEWMRGAWIQPGAFFARRLRREWNDENSDIRAARSFLKLPDDEKLRWGVTWKSGSWEEVRRILRALMLLDHDGDDRILVTSAPVNPPGGLSISYGCNKAPQGKTTRVWTRLLERNRAVLFDASRLRKPAPRPFAFNAGTPAWPRLEVAVEAPSQHERLEARLELREWLHSFAPDLENDWRA